MSVDLSDDYRPSDDEEFMNERQLAFFRRLLENWKADILDGAKQTINNLQDESGSLPDIVDRASAESDKALELRTRDRQRKLISKIDSALRRIEQGDGAVCRIHRPDNMQVRRNTKLVPGIGKAHLQLVRLTETLVRFQERNQLAERAKAPHIIPPCNAQAGV